MTNASAEAGSSLSGNVHDIGKPCSLVLRSGRVLVAGQPAPQTCDIGIGPDGTIAHLGTGFAAGPGCAVADIAGRLVVPGLVDMHQHLDKTRTRDVAPNPDGTLAGAVRAYNDYARTASAAEIMRRAGETVEACIAHGTVAIRSHVNVGAEMGLRGVEALIALRERLAGRIVLQLVALAPAAAAGSPAAVRDWLDAAAAAGADALGGAPAHAQDSDAFLALIFDAAERHGLPVDLHLDEHLDATRHHFHKLIALTQARGMQGRVAAGHCSALAALPDRDAAAVIDGLARAGIGVVALPAANLYLLGREAGAGAPRGITRVAALRRAGVAVAVASDNIQDAFVPTGSGDLVELARWTMLAAQLDAGDGAAALDMISEVPARLMQLAGSGIRVGARADLLITCAADAGALIAGGALERTVLAGGKVVAGSLPVRALRTGEPPP